MSCLMQNAMASRCTGRYQLTHEANRMKCSSRSSQKQQREVAERGARHAIGGFGAAGVSFFLLFGAVSAFSFSFLRSATSS